MPVTSRNVRGWPGGAWWINSATLLERKQFLDRVARADDSRSAPKLAMAAGMSSGMGGETMAEADKKAEQREKREMAAMRKVDLNLQAWSDEVGRLGYAPEKVLLPVPPVDGASMAKGSERVRVLLLDPAYQLK